MSALQVILALAPFIEQYGPQVIQLLVGLADLLEHSGLPQDTQQAIGGALAEITKKAQAADAIAVLKNHLAAGDHDVGVLPNWPPHR